MDLHVVLTAPVKTWNSHKSIRRRAIERPWKSQLYYFMAQFTDWKSYRLDTELAYLRLMMYMYAVEGWPLSM
jgi:hypothetical protein